MSLRNFRRELRASVGRVCAYQIHDGRGAAIAPVLESTIRGERVRDRDLLSALEADDVVTTDEGLIADLEATAERLAAPMIIPAGRGGKATALISVRGLCLYQTEFQPVCFSTALLAQTMNTLAQDPEIGTIVMVFDTPGGITTGVLEAADAIFAARQQKRVVALIDPLCASAGYWLASQASEIVSVPSGDAGSIGVFVAHANCAGLMEQMGVEMTFIYAGAFKIEGNPYEGLSDEARSHIQGEVDTIYASFLKAVARGRNVPVSKVEADFGQGRTLMAPAAKKAGMVDRVMPINQAMARWGVSAQTLEGRRRGEDVAPEPAAHLSPDEMREIENMDDPLVSAEMGDVVTIKNGRRYLKTARNDVVHFQCVELDDGTITFASAERTPDLIDKVRIVDEDTGEEVSGVVECNAKEGWLTRHALEDGAPIICNRSPPCHECDAHEQHVRTERVEGRFRIERQPAPPLAAVAEMIMFRTEQDGDATRHYVTGEWPEIARFSFELVQNRREVAESVLSLDGDKLTVTAANGFAVYDEMDADDIADRWIGRLVESEYEAAPEQPEPAATSDSTRRHRRLARLRHA